MREDDISHCETIYRLNEPGHFPDGYFDRFCEWLREKSSLVLVAEASGRFCGFGGLRKIEQEDIRLALLGFDMIHPDFHREGFGTALLFARISILPVPDSEWILGLTSAGTSHTFYKRFGFRYLKTVTDVWGKLDWYRAHVRKPEWDECHARLRQAGITVDIGDAYIPTTSAP